MREIGADHPPRPRPLGAGRGRCPRRPAPVPGPALPAPMRSSPPAVVLEAGQPTAEAGQVWRRPGSRRRRGGRRPSRSPRRAGPTPGRPRRRSAASAERTAPRSGSRRTRPARPRPVPDRPGPACRLGPRGSRPPGPAGAVLAAAQCVDVGRRAAGVGRGLDLWTAPRPRQIRPALCAPSDHEPVAAVAVGAEQVRVDDGDRSAPPVVQPFQEPGTRWPAGDRRRPCSCR